VIGNQTAGSIAGHPSVRQLSGESPIAHASLTFHSPWATGPGLWFCYQMSLNIGYGAIPVAVGLTELAIYGRVTSALSVVVMAAVCVSGIILTWYAGRL
jgi:hypothetical protein